MEKLIIIPDLAKHGFREGEYDVVEHKGPMTIGGMERGTESGNPVVMIGLDMGEGVLVVKTTLALFLSAADALKARYGDPR